MDEWVETIVPLERKITLEVVGVLQVFVVEFGPGDLLPGVEILEVVVLEVVEYEFFVFGGRHKGGGGVRGMLPLHARLAPHHIITTSYPNQI